MKGHAVAGGILIIITASACMLMGILGIIAYQDNINHPYWQANYQLYAIMGVVGILTYGLGLSGGILSLIRRLFALSIIGTCFTILSGLVTILSIVWGMPDRVSENLTLALASGLPITFLSAAGLVLIALSKDEFT